VLERPQSNSGDFYRELGDILSVKREPSNRRGGSKSLRERWRVHVASTRIKPALLIDEGAPIAERDGQTTWISGEVRFLRQLLLGQFRLVAEFFADRRTPRLVPIGCRDWSIA
jgi:hypothetical protein